MVLLNSIKEQNVRVLEVEGCRSSVDRALAAKAIIQTPLGEKISI